MYPNFLGIIIPPYHTGTGTHIQKRTCVLHSSQLKTNNIHTEIRFLITKNNFCCCQNYEQTNRDLKYIYIKYIHFCNEQLDQELITIKAEKNFEDEFNYLKNTKTY